jgi:hypothetical protein
VSTLCSAHPTTNMAKIIKSIFLIMSTDLILNPTMSIWFLYNTLGPQSCGITPRGRMACESANCIRRI